MRNACHNHLSGVHGQARAWAARKIDELGALNATLRRLFA